MKNDVYSERDNCNLTSDLIDAFSGLTSGAELESVLSTVRLQLMTVSELLGVVRPLKLVTPDTILDALTLRTTCRDSALKYRGALSEFFMILENRHN